MVTTLLALEVERTRAPERAGEAAVGSFVNAVLDGQIDDRRDLIARGKELGIDLENGGCVLVVRIMPACPAEGDWQARALTIVGARRAQRRAGVAGRTARRPHGGDRARRRRRAQPPRRASRRCARSTTGCPASSS